MPYYKVEMFRRLIVVKEVRKLLENDLSIIRGTIVLRLKMICECFKILTTIIG